MGATRLTTALVLATLGAAAPAAAQRWPTVELGAFGQYTVFGNVLGLDDVPGLGAMGGLFILPNLVAEGDISFSGTDGPLSGRSGKACPGTVTFASTDNAISPAGIYVGRGPGTSTVTASYEARGQRVTATANVTVNRPPPPRPAPTPLPAVCVSGIDINPDTGTVLRGETLQFTVRARTCAGSDTTVTVSYTGGNVDPNGRFTAGNDTGVVQITATTSVGGRALTDVANIRVVLMRSTVVNFDLNASAVDGPARSRLDQLIAALRANPRVTVCIEGHADTIRLVTRASAGARCACSWPGSTRDAPARHLLPV